MGRIKRLGRFAIAIACAAVLVCTLAPAAFADTAGNTIASAEATTSKDLGTVGGNLYWVGRTLDLGSGNVGGDVIAAGQEIDANSATVGGNIRTASENAFITGTTVSGDITSAGRNLKVGEGTTCAGAYLAGATIEFAGTAKALAAAAQTVTISGTINGDVYVDAGSVLVTDSAVITGTLTVNSSNQPQVASGAKVGKLDFHQEASSDQVDEPAITTFSVFGLFYFAIVFAIIAIVMAWALRRAVDGAGEMVRTRTAPMLVTGLIAIMVAIPVIGLLFLVAPLAGSVICAYGMVFFVAAPFAGASLARLIFPGWNRFGAAALGGAVAGILVAIPVVRAIFVFAAFMYLLGYALQCIYLDMKGDGAGRPMPTPAQVNPNGPMTMGYTAAPANSTGAPIPPAGATVPAADTEPIQSAPEAR
jgi:cytoskeletal protein CcmA (bactofilin family)